MLNVIAGVFRILQHLNPVLMEVNQFKLSSNQAADQCVAAAGRRLRPMQPASNPEYLIAVWDKKQKGRPSLM